MSKLLEARENTSDRISIGLGQKSSANFLDKSKTVERQNQCKPLYSYENYSSFARFCVTQAQFLLVAYGVGLPFFFQEKKNKEGGGGGGRLIIYIILFCTISPGQRVVIVPIFKWHSYMDIDTSKVLRVTRLKDKTRCK